MGEYKKNAKKEVIVIVVLFVAVIIASVYFHYNSSSQIIANDSIRKVCIDNSCFNVEVVDTPETRRIGLMYRESLDENAGMLFIFEEAKNYPFWMKNTLIPLDIIWINYGMKIVAITDNTQPCPEDGDCNPINPRETALYVLEVNSGKASELGIALGDIVRFK